MIENPEVKPSPENVTDLDVMNEDQIVDHSGDTLDENKLLNSVKNRFKKRAKELLTELKKYPDEISVQSDGSLNLGGKQLPDANFYSLFPLLYRPVSKHRENATLSALIDTVASLGLGHLILRNYTAGITPKGKNYLHGRGSLLKHLKKQTPWYFLGGGDND